MEQDAALSVTRAGQRTADTDDRLYPARPLLAASLAVIRDSRVLLARRAAPPLAGCFTLPGGLVEPGETLAAAALREMREEVGIAAEIIGFNRHVEVIERDAGGRVSRHYVIASFVGAWIAGDGTPGPEAEAVAWVRRDELASYRTTDHLASLLDAAFALATTISATPEDRSC